MSKKFTSFMVLAVALLLTVPAQAQFAKKQTKSPHLTAFKAGPQKAIDLKKAQAAKKKMAESQVEGLAFTGKAFNLLAQLEKVQEDKAVLEKQMEENLRQVKYGKMASFRNVGTIVSNKGIISPRSITFNAGMPSTTRRANRAEVVDQHGIITSPAEGESKFYTRTGKEYYSSNGNLSVDDQEGMTEIVECTDGTIYIKDFVSSVNAGTWVKGTKSGNTITIPAKQVVWYGSSYGIYLAKATYVEATGWSEVAGDFVLTVDGNTITLNGTDEDNPVAGFWTDDFKFAGYGNYETVFTYDPTYVPPTLVVLPDGAEVETWYQEQTDKNGSGDTDGLTKVAFVGNDVYFSGLFKSFPNSWIKGTISGTTVTFSGLQFLGEYSGYNIFATGATGNTTSDVLQDFQMTYDADAKKFTSVNYLLVNAAEDRVYYLEAYEDIVISKEPFAEPEATTGDNVDALPYNNALATAAQFADFGVIDSNKDGTTWVFNNGTYYSYSSSNAADDWLISPAIKLEAGKKYHFAIDAAAKSTSYPETFEVKIGTEPKASALTQSILSATDVTSTDYVTYENEMVSVSTTGYYHFGIHCISAVNMFRLMVKNFLVEDGVETDAPAAVSDFALTQTEGKLEVNVKFTAPTKTVGGDHLTSITKVDILRNGQVIKSLANVTPGSEQTYVDNEGLSVGNYTYQVIPYNEVGAGAKSEEKTIFISVALDVPHTFDFSQDLLDLFTVIDNNNDGRTWLWTSSNKAYYRYSDENAADDYLITLPFNLKAGKTYNVIVNAKNTGYTEKFEVKAGKEATVAGLTQTVIAETTIDDEEGEWADYEGQFTATEDGQYFFAIHAISPKDQYYLCVSTLTIEASAEATAPAAISDFTATPGAKGALEANLTFTAPTKAVDGSALTGTVDVKIYRDNNLVNTLTGVAIGSAQTWKDTNVEDGKTYTYYVVAANAAGDGLKSEKVSVFVGVDEIGDVTGIKVTGTTTNTISLSWDEVEGVHGGYVNTADIKYAVVSMHVEVRQIGYYSFQTLVVDNVLGPVTGQTSGTFNYAVDEGEQGYKYFGVVAYTDDADTPAIGDDDYAGNYDNWLIGAPYTLPFIESFPEGTYKETWTLVATTDNRPIGMFTDDASDEDGTALMFTTVEEAGNVQLESGKISLANAANPTLIFDAKGAGITTATVYGSKDDGEWQVIATPNITDQYQTVKVPLKDANGERFIRFAIGATIANPAIYEGMDPQTYQDIYEYHDLLYVDNIKVMDLYQYNLKAEIEAPATVVAGKTAKVVATITNEGENAVKDYTVTIKAGEKVLTTVLGSEELAPFAKDVIDVEYKTSVFDKAGDVTLTATVEYENDLNPDDDTATTIIKITESTAPKPEDFTATDKGDDGVDLTWGAPEVPDLTYVTESFETEGDMGGFTTIDADDDGYNWAQHLNTGSQNLSTKTGDGCVFSESYNNDTYTALTPDNWLVTPLAVLNGEFSFWACGQDKTYYGEHFAVFVSTTSATDPSAFTMVSEEFVATNDMTEYKVDLSAYAGQTGYIAIRHYNVTDMFVLVVDDITYAPAAPATSRVASAGPTSYNIYYEGNKIASVEGDKTSYTVPASQITAGSRTFGLTAVYADGSESKPVTSEVEVTTGIKQIATDGKPVDIYAIDGKLVRRQSKSFDGLKGLYIINGKKVLIK